MNNGSSRWVGPLLGVATAVVYGISLSRGAFPGDSAIFITQYCGLAPLQGTDHPLWGLLAWLIGCVPGGDLAVRLNLFSLLCGGMSVWLLHDLVLDTLAVATQDGQADRASSARAAALGGIGAGLFLAFCIPFWLVSNRAHPASFDILLLLVLCRLFLVAVRDLNPAVLCGFAFLYGIGVTEFATLVILAPLFAFILVVVLWQREQLTSRRVVTMAAFGLAGLLFYFVGVFRFSASASGQLLQLNVGQILWGTLRNQYNLILFSLPREGWLVIIFLTVIPWLAMLIVARRALSGEGDWGITGLHVIMSGLAVMTLFNIGVTPWHITGARRLLVTPYVLTAFVYGYLIAYWYLLPHGWAFGLDTAGKRRLGWVLMVLLVLPGLGSLLAAPFLNFKLADARAAGPVNRYAASIVEHLSGRSWLITDGRLDANILLAAHDARTNVHLLDVARSGDGIYMALVGRAMETPRLRSLAHVGVLPLLTEWFSTDPAIGQKVALTTSPDLWMLGGNTAVPNMSVILGVRNTRDIRVDTLLREHEAFWDRMASEFLPLSRSHRTLSGLADHLLRTMSQTANDLGVLFTDVGRPDDAFKAYARALEMYPGNASAILNQYSLVQGGFKTPTADAVKARYETLAQAEPGKSSYSICGYVRTPEAFASLSRTWALMGNADLAMAGFRKAIDLDKDKSEQLRYTLASLHLSHNQLSESETILRDLIRQEPATPAPYLAMARVAGRKGDFKEADTLLDQAEKRKADPVQLALDRATILLMSNRHTDARKILEALLKERPQLAQAWVMLVTVLLQDDASKADPEALDQCVRKLADLKQEYSLCLARGQIAMARNNLTESRRHYERALALRPGDVPVLEILLRLDYFEGKPTHAQNHVRRLLSAAPDSALGNYVLGSLQLMNNQTALAETSFRKSLQNQRMPEVLNDLAWLLQEKGAYTEAETLARESVEKNPTLYHAQDTLGVVLLRTGRLDEAEKAFTDALAVRSSYVRAMLHLVEVHLKRGNTAEGRQMLTSMADKRVLFSSEDRDLYDALHRRLASGE